MEGLRGHACDGSGFRRRPGDGAEGDSRGFHRTVDLLKGISRQIEVDKSIGEDVGELNHGQHVLGEVQVTKIWTETGEVHGECIDVVPSE